MLTISNPARSSVKQGCYEHSSTQVNLPRDLSAQVIRWGERNIKDSDLYEEVEEPPSRYAREYQSHVTIMYGIQETDPKRVLSIFRGTKSFPVELGKVSLFKLSNDFDVVKVEAFAPQLFDLNEVVKQRLKTTQLYPNYSPHVTIAFIKKNTCDHLHGNMNFFGQEFIAKEIQFSNCYEERVIISLEDFPGNRRCAM